MHPFEILDMFDDPKLSIRKRSHILLNVMKELPLSESVFFGNFILHELPNNLRESGIEKAETDDEVKFSDLMYAWKTWNNVEPFPLSSLEKEWMLKYAKNRLRLRVGLKNLFKECSRMMCVPLSKLEDAYAIKKDGGLVLAMVMHGESIDVDFDYFEPVAPMLAHTWDKSPDIFQKSRWVLELKLKGKRIQYHEKDGEYRVYSQSLKEVEAPNLILTGTNCILDGVLTTRISGEKVPIFFDVLKLEGIKVTHLSLSKRREMLESITDISDVKICSGVPFRSVAEVITTYQKYVYSGFEGMMLKNINSKYIPRANTRNWLKYRGGE